MKIASIAEKNKRGRRCDGVNFRAVAASALSNAPAILRRWLPDGRRVGREYISVNPLRTDRHAGSFRINLTNGKWADFAIGVSGGDLVSLASYLFAISQSDAARQIAAMLGMRHE